jgi:hypothetical protein
VGYYTQYSLKQIRNAIPETELSALINADDCARLALDWEGDTRGPEKWYEHETTVCAWSSRYPDTLFLLHAEGEDSDGIWNKYFLGGQRVHIDRFNGLPNLDM